MKIFMKNKIWTKKQLKVIYIIFFNKYKKAVKVSLSNDLIMKFKKNFVRFKKNHREKYQTIK